MTREELNYIKDAFSQIIDDIAGNPDWGESARAVASDLGTLERKLEEKISSLPSNLDEVAEKEIERFCSDMLNVDIIWARMQLTKRFGLQMAKFGAEWMAGQFQNIDGELVDWYETNGVDYCHGISTDEAFEVPEGFYIRKK